MEIVLLVLLIAAAASVCPAMMWWQRRRGRDPSCHIPLRRANADAVGDDPDLDELRRRRDVISARIAELEDPPDQVRRSPSAR